jgi:antitoxin (DNA-binding transcriptional repressor) of toxin-antitoxin stability system
MTAVAIARAVIGVDVGLHRPYDAFMRTVGTRELKQNPQAVIQRVLETGEDHEITAYGQPTGVRLVRDEPRPKQWVTGAELMAMDIEPMSKADRDAWKKDMEGFLAEEPTDPWEQQQ